MPEQEVFRTTDGSSIEMAKSPKTLVSVKESEMGSLFSSKIKDIHVVNEKNVSDDYFVDI